MMNAVQMVVIILKKNLFLRINQCDLIETEMVLETVLSHVRSGVFDSCFIENKYSESHSMFNTLCFFFYSM
jgi:hypothetical protein